MLEMVRRQVAVIVVNTHSMAAAKAATATIPIVFASADDPELAHEEAAPRPAAVEPTEPNL